MMISQTLDAPVVFDIPDFDDDVSDYEIPSASSLLETPEGFHAELLAAGRKKENFSIKVENNQLVVNYEQEKTERPTEWKQIRNEFNIGNFSRSFTFDETVDTNQIQAKYEDGLLKVFIPKKPEVKQAAVTINVQ